MSGYIYFWIKIFKDSYLKSKEKRCLKVHSIPITVLTMAKSEAYIKSALEKGFKAFGFSAHAPVLNETGWNMKMKDFEEYVNTTKILKASTRQGGCIVNRFMKAQLTGGRKKVWYTIEAVHFLVDKNK